MTRYSVEPQDATEVLKIALKRVIWKTAEATSDLIGSKSADKIIKVSITSPQYTSEAVTNETENIGLDRKTEKKDSKYQKVINLLGNTPIQPLSLGQKIGLK